MISNERLTLDRNGEIRNNWQQTQRVKFSFENNKTLHIITFQEVIT